MSEGTGIALIAKIVFGILFIVGLFVFFPLTAEYSAMAVQHFDLGPGFRATITGAAAFILIGLVWGVPGVLMCLLLGSEDFTSKNAHCYLGSLATFIYCGVLFPAFGLASESDAMNLTLSFGLLNWGVLVGVGIFLLIWIEESISPFRRLIRKSGSGN